MDPPDEEPELKKLLAPLLEREPGAPTDEQLDRAWPDMVKRARIEAERRQADASREPVRRGRRWRRMVLVAVALAACIGATIAIAHFVDREPPLPTYSPWEVKASPRFRPWPGDLTRWDVFAEYVRAVGADAKQQAKSEALVARALEHLERLPESASQDDVATVHSDLRTRIGALLDADQRKRFLEFCAERDRQR